jgi:Tat protein translocase TatC
MTLGEHLEELRQRLLRSAIALLVAFLLSWVLHERIAQVALLPLERSIAWTNEFLVEQAEQRLRADPSLPRTELFESADPADQRLLRPVTKAWGRSAGSGFMFYMRCCLYSGVVLAGAYILWQLWLFVAAGLYPRERRVVYGFFPLSVGLFFGGVVFGYFVMVPYAQYFLARVSIGQIHWQPTIEEYFYFLRNLCLGLGFVFQLPVVMLVLARVQLVEPAWFARYRGHFLVVALIVAAVLTPPDVVSQTMMAVPMIVLYELGIVMARVARRKAAAKPPGAVAP